MARPKKGDVDELAAVSKDIDAQTEKLRKLKEKQKRLQEADNIKLGQLVKSVFKDRLPNDMDERKAFLSGLLDNVPSEQAPSVHTEPWDKPSGEPDVVRKSGGER